MKLVTSPLLVQTMNSIAREEEVADQLPALQEKPESDEIASQQSTVSEGESEPVETEESSGNEVEGPIEPVEESKESETDEEPTSAEVIEEPQTTRSGITILKPAHYMAVTKVDSRQWKEEATDTAITLELTMLFKDLKALRVIRRAQVLGGKVLKSHMFVVT